MAAGTLRLAFVSVASAALSMGQRGAVDAKASFGYQGFADESLVGHGLVGGSARFYIARWFAVEPEFLYLKGGRDHHDLTLTPMAVFEWGGGRVRPYATAGVGLIWARYGDFGRSITAREAYGTGGAGVKVYVNHGWFVAPDIRIGWEAHVRASLGIGYTWRP
ncbi:MAG TPA: outer membrane beta-barrel protein [Bryobacteraceae bacterium]|nr:outer membrane beta-barrel protein [Bryobacteraceae bacterium]